MTTVNRMLRDVMRPPFAVEQSDTIRLAAERMAEKNVGALTVVDGGKVIGLLSNRDLIAKALAKSLPASTPVADLMNPRPVRISDDRDVENALLVMKARRVHELLVQDFTGKVVGVYCDCGCCDHEVSAQARAEVQPRPIKEE